MSAATRSAARPAPGASVLRGSLALLSTQPFTWASSVLLVMFVPRYLGDQALGEFTVAATLNTLAGTVASLGIPDYLVRHVATRPERETEDVGAAVVLLTGSGLLVAGVLAAALLLVQPLIGNHRLLLVSLVGLVVQNVQNPLMALLRGGERHVRFAWLNATATVLGALLGLGVLVAGGDVVAYMGSVVASAAVVTVLAALAIRFRLTRAAFEPAVWWDLGRHGLAFLGTNVTLRLRGEVDHLLLAGMASAAAVGWYAAAIRLVAIPIFVPTLVVTPLLPALSRCADNPPVFLRTLRRSIELVLMLTVPLGAAMLALAPTLPDLLGWGGTFGRSVPLVMILAGHMLLVGVNMVLGVALVALHRERDWLRVVLAAAIFNPAVNLLAIRYCEDVLGNGAIGAALTTALTEALMFAGAIWMLPRGTLGKPMLVPTLRVLVAGAAFGGLLHVMEPAGLIVAVGVSGTLWALATLGLGTLRPADLGTIGRVAVGVLGRRTGDATVA